MHGIPLASVAASGEDGAEITDSRVAELVAAAWVRRFGWPDAEATPVGHDEGIDVWAKGAVAQVKCWGKTKPGIRHVQRLAGSAKLGQAHLFFFTSGYTKAALLWSYHPDNRVALFELSPDGHLIACNWYAWRIARRAPLRLPYALRAPTPRALYVCLGSFSVLNGAFLLWLTALALVRGAYTTAMGANFTIMVGTMGIASVGIVIRTLGPEARRFILAARRYRQTGSWADWRGPSRLSPPIVTPARRPTSLWGMRFSGWYVSCSSLRTSAGGGGVSSAWSPADCSGAIGRSAPSPWGLRGPASSGPRVKAAG
jgi:Restriction endonuclease